MTDTSELQGLVNDALALLTPYSRGSTLPTPGGTVPLESLLEQCREHVAKLGEQKPPPVRMIHHFACTGGTLISRALASQPNTMVLSEVDPFSQWFRPPGQFAPTDLIFLSRLDRSPPEDKTIASMFHAALRVLYDALTAQGRHLLIRGHPHSHFCAPAPESRPLFGALVQQEFNTRQIITVRHPLDSYLSLCLMNSATGPVSTLEGYASRYMMFLDSYPGVDVFQYESFVETPDETCQEMADCLELEFNPRWQDVLPTIRLSGDSGRRGRKISKRPRRGMLDTIQAELEQGCDAYVDLCMRLGYNPDPAVSAYPSG